VPAETAEDRQFRLRLELAKAEYQLAEASKAKDHERVKDLWAFRAFLALLVVIVVAALALVFLPGTTAVLKTAAWSTLAAIVSGAVVHLKGKSGKSK
jgi:hypothetical protein